jgi:hypothetical protein
MRKRYSQIIIFLWLSCLCHVFAAPAATLQEKLDTPLSLQMHATGLDTILELSPVWKPLEIQADPTLLCELRKNKLRCSIHIRDVDVKYVLGWMIHLAGANGEIRDDGSIRIADRDAVKKNDPRFECYKETEGEWRDALGKVLEKKAFQQNLANAPVGSYLTLMGAMYGLPVLIDPKVIEDKTMRVEILFEGGSEMTVAEQIQAVLGRAGLIYKVQGGVLFITK